ncbi:MAG: methyltransferase domain-containing protein [Gemmatimonadota bacterium]
MRRIGFSKSAWLMATLLLPTVGFAQEPAVDLDVPGRRSAEVERDMTSKPLEVIEWIGLEPGASIADLMAGSGYHTWIFSQYVGPEGQVWAQSSYRPDTLKARIESGDLSGGNVHYVEQIADLPDGEFDLVFTDRNYHDLDVEEVPAVLATIRQKLKSGGLFVVIDARASEGRDEDGHRIADDVIISEVTAAGFELVESSEMLANPDDDHAGGDFETRDALDRSLLKFQSPGGEAEAGAAHEGHAPADSSGA